MTLEEVKKLVNINLISEAAKNTNLEGTFISILVGDFSREVWQVNWDMKLDKDVEEYLEKLEAIIRREILNTLKTLKYKNLEI